MSDKEYPEAPEQNACGGYYCSEEHGHIDCKDMPKNLHIIVGDSGRCLCGVYNGTPILCCDFLASLGSLVSHAKINGSGVYLYASDILKIEKVIRSYVQER